MVTATKSGIDNLISNASSSLSAKSTSEFYKMDSSKAASKSDDYKKEEFKDVLSSKAASKENESEKVENVNRTNTSDNSTTNEVSEKDATNKIQELKDKLKELEENSDEASGDQVSDILKELLSLLSNLGIDEEKIKQNLEEAASGNLSKIVAKISELLKNDLVQKGLDSNSLKFLEKILSNLSAKTPADNTELSKDIRNNMKSLMSEISEMLNKAKNQEQATKVLTLEDILNKKNPQENKESSLGNNTNKNLSSETSKEDKFLNSLIDDDSDSTLNKINLFASRTQNMQNQPIDNGRGLTINKATFVNDLIKDVKFMSTNALKELTVKVNPGNLGEITIKLIQEDGVMKANLKANSKETTALLSQNLVDIKKQLSEQNIKIADVNIELYQDDTTFYKENSFGSQFSEQNGSQNNNNVNVINNEMVSEDELLENIASIENNVEFFA